VAVVSADKARLLTAFVGAIEKADGFQELVSGTTRLEQSPGSRTAITMAEIVPVQKFERFFRMAAELDVDKNDLRRYSDFVQTKTYDLLLRGEAAARANGRDIIQPHDLPITKGLQECMHEFRKIDGEIQLKPALDYATARPPLELAYSADTDEQLGTVAGGLSVALARSFKVIDPTLKNPQTLHWDRAFQMFNLLL
jgi:hypothetical protein